MLDLVFLVSEYPCLHFLYIFKFLWNTILAIRHRMCADKNLYMFGNGKFFFSLHYEWRARRAHQLLSGTYRRNTHIKREPPQCKLETFTYSQIYTHIYSGCVSRAPQTVQQYGVFFFLVSAL